MPSAVTPMISRIRIALLLGLALVVPFLFYPFQYNPTSNLTLKLTVIQLAIALIATLWMHEHARWPVRRGAIQSAMVLFLVAAALSWIVSEDAALSSHRFVFTVLMFVLVWMIGSGPDLYDRWSRVVTAVAVLLSAYCILQSIGLDILGLGKYSIGTAAVTLSHRNILASALILTFPFVVHRWFMASGRKQKIRSGVMGVGVLAAVLLTQTRGAWIALALAMGLFVVLRVRSVTHARWGEVLLGAKARIAGLVVLLAAVLLVGIHQCTPLPVVDRLQRLIDFRDPNTQYRLATWRCGLDNFRDHPLLGSGIGTFRSAYMKYEGRYLKGEHRFEDLSPYAHNDYVEIMSDMGVAGIVAFLVLMAVIFRAALRCLCREDADVRKKMIVITCLTAMTTALLHSVTHYGLHEPVVTMFFWATAGLILFHTSVPDPRPVRGGAPFPVAMIFLRVAMLGGMVAACWFLFPPMRNEMAVENTMAALTRRDYPEALRHVDQAIQIQPENAQNYFMRGNVLWFTKEYVEAMQAYNQAILLQSHNPSFYVNRGAAYQSMGDLNSAMRDFNRALEMNPNQANAYALRGEIDAQLGQWDNAVRDWKEAVLLNHPESKRLQERLDSLSGGVEKR